MVNIENTNISGRASPSKFNHLSTYEFMKVDLKNNLNSSDMFNSERLEVNSNGKMQFQINILKMIQ